MGTLVGQSFDKYVEVLIKTDAFGAMDIVVVAFELILQ